MTAPYLSALLSSLAAAARNNNLTRIHGDDYSAAEIRQALDELAEQTGAYREQRDEQGARAYQAERERDQARADLRALEQRTHQGRSHRQVKLRMTQAE